MASNNPEQKILKSTNMNKPVYVTFVNTTPYSVEVLWINYSGHGVRYVIMKPSTYCDINTFVTHPWIFVDKDTKERFMVRGKTVYMPNALHTAENKREVIAITLPMYSLRNIALKAVKRRLRYNDQAFALDIPRSLQEELARLLPKKKNPQRP